MCSNLIDHSGQNCKSGRGVSRGGGEVKKKIFDGCIILSNNDLEGVIKVKDSFLLPIYFNYVIIIYSDDWNIIIIGMPILFIKPILFYLHMYLVLDK